MSDPIDRNTAISHVYVALFPNVRAAEKADKALREMPTIDAVEVVRCKDCSHYMSEGCLVVRSNKFAFPNGFCNWGERRTDETD